MHTLFYLFAPSLDNVVLSLLKLSPSSLITFPFPPICAVQFHHSLSPILTMLPSTDVFRNVHTYGPVPEANNAIKLFFAKGYMAFANGMAVPQPNQTHQAMS